MAFPRLFRIFYSTFFTILNIFTLALLLITPADAVHQALSNNQLYNVFAIGGCFVLTLLLAIVIYASRLYTNRSILAAIPKTWVPVEKGDVGKSVRKMIVESLSRSAVIAWDARPRIDSHVGMAPATEQEKANKKCAEGKEKQSAVCKLLRKKRAVPEKDERRISIVPHAAVWGEITHDGWSPPNSPDLPNLQFVTVILELPHLIEAKAVLLAPPDPTSTTSPPMPDLRAVELLQRPAAMVLRDYIAHLTTLGVLSPSAPVNLFLSAYETSRFSQKPITEPKFRELMRLFADILRNMIALDPGILDKLDDEDDGEEKESEGQSSIDGDTSSNSTPDTRSLASSHSGTLRSRSGSEGTIRTAPSRSRSRVKASNKATNINQRVDDSKPVRRSPRIDTVPSTPQEKKQNIQGGTERSTERALSMRSFSQSRRMYPVSQVSSSSLRSAVSGSRSRSVSGSGSGGSVIKLRMSSDSHAGDLPYEIQLGVGGPV